jgi:8-oxo-dGTP diphosphatase
MKVKGLINNVKFFQKCIIVNDKGQILALRRDLSDVRRPGCWDFPGGTYEVGEDVIESVQREVKEEANLIAKKVLPIYISNKTGISNKDVTVIAVSHYCVDWEGEVKISDEHVEYRWVTVEEFMSLDTGDDEDFLKNSLRAYIALPHHA